METPIVYEIDVTQLDGTHSCFTFEVQDPEEVIQILEEYCVGNVVIGIDASTYISQGIEGRSTRGGFVIWCNSNRVYAFIDACESGDPRFTAVDASLCLELTHNVHFLEEAPMSVWKHGQTESSQHVEFDVPFNHTISREQLLEAVTFWLLNQKRISTLDWRLPQDLNPD